MNLLRFIDRFSPPRIAFAHCDIPCGIYKSEPSRTAAATVVKMVDKLISPPPIDENDKQSRLNFHNNMTRFVLAKEEHAEICKREVLILWTDFFKSEHLEKYPDLHDKIWKITKLCSDNKRSVSLEKAQELLKAVNELGNIFDEANK